MLENLNEIQQLNHAANLGQSKNAIWLFTIYQRSAVCQQKKYWKLLIKRDSTDESDVPQKTTNKIGTALKQSSHSQHAKKIRLAYEWARFDLHNNDLHENGQSLYAMFWSYLFQWYVSLPGWNEQAGNWFDTMNFFFCKKLIAPRFYTIL